MKKLDDVYFDFVGNGKFRHYHNGAMFATYPNSNDSLPHAYYGALV